MDTTDKCPICGKSHKIIQSDGYYTIFCCSENRCYCLYDWLFDGIDDLTAERWKNAIYNYVERYPFNNKAGRNFYWKFFYEETDETPPDDCFVNLYHLMRQYPYQVIDRIDNIMLNLARKYPLLSDMFNIVELADKDYRLLYCESKNKLLEVASIFSALDNSHYIEIAKTDKSNVNNNRYRISVNGWKHIAELTRSQEGVKQGFIAMSFDDNVKYIGDIFQQAIRQAGFEPRIIKDKEHNNYIMPEIFHEIKASKFVVVDITKPNYGAYYEAGYAQALNKDVIVCCKKEVFDNAQTKPHFDIAQKSMIIWEDEKDLLFRLERRIRATVK